MFLLRCVGCSVAVTEQYIGEMETRFIKETEMFRAISRAKTSDRDLSRWNRFDHLFEGGHFGGTPVDIGKLLSSLQTFLQLVDM